mgnify:CR=1 FL=1
MPVTTIIRQVLLGGILLGISALARGQQLTWSEPLPWEGESYHTRFIKPLSSGFLLLAQNPYSRQQFALAHFGDNLSLQHKQNFEAPKNSRLQKTVIIKDSIFFFFDQKANDSTRLLSQSYNPQTDSLHDPRAITRFPGENTSIYLSRASDSMVNAVAINSNIQKLTYLRLDHRLRIRTSSIYQLEQAFNLGSIISAIAEGSATALIGKGMDSEEVIYCSLDSSAQSLRSCSLSNDSLSVTTARLGYDQVNDQFMATGLYQLASGNTYHGIARLKDEQEGDFNRSYEDFSQELVRRLFGRNTTRRGLVNFQLRGLIPRSDGGAVVFLESYQNDQKVYHDRGYFGTVNKTERDYHYYEEVVVMAINSRGRTQGSEVHRKKQTTVNDDGRFSSFSYMIQKKLLIFIYNSLNSGALNLLYYTVTPQGELKGELLLKDRYDQLKPIPRKATQVGPYSVLMPSLKEGRLHLLQVDFNP